MVSFTVTSLLLSNIRASEYINIYSNGYELLPVLLISPLDQTKLCNNPSWNGVLLSLQPLISFNANSDAALPFPSFFTLSAVSCNIVCISLPSISGMVWISLT